MRPPWKLSRLEYYRAIASRSLHKGSLIYRINGLPFRALLHSEAWDFAGFHKEVGHFFIIQRQLLRTRSLEFLSYRNFIEVDYLPVWMKFFREHPDIQWKGMIDPQFIPDVVPIISDEIEYIPLKEKEYMRPPRDPELDEIVAMNIARFSPPDVRTDWTEKDEAKYRDLSLPYE